MSTVLRKDDNLSKGFFSTAEPLIWSLLSWPCKIGSLRSRPVEKGRRKEGKKGGGFAFFSLPPPPLPFRRLPRRAKDRRLFSSLQGLLGRERKHSCSLSRYPGILNKVQSINRGGYAPKSHSIPFYQPFLTETLPPYIII